MGTSALGQKIRTLRKTKGLTLEELAKMIGAGKSYLWELENKGVENPSAERLTKLADILGVTPEFLLNDKLVSPEPEVVDQAFFRQYQQLDPDTKKRIRQILELWKEDG